MTTGIVILIVLGAICIGAPIVGLAVNWFQMGSQNPARKAKPVADDDVGES